MMTGTLEGRLAILAERGVVIDDPRQVYVAPNVQLDRICRGAVLHPGTRLLGARTFVGPGAQVGSEGPAVVDNAVLAGGAEVASGFITGSVLLAGARLGANAHVRANSLLEEEASTAHAVGLKQTILMAFVTVGSLVNFCDALMSGGRSRGDHSEIGSGFIHFNFTPFGEFGDKATSSLIGNVTEGVFLREDRVFLGGLSGLVGPQKVGFGAVTIAGQVLRRQVPAGHLFGSVGAEIDKPFARHRTSAPAEKVAKNVEYIRELFALRAWYREVRLARVPLGDYETRTVLKEAAFTIERCIEERVLRLNALLRGLGERALQFEPEELPCPLPVEAQASYVEHVDWVRSLSEDEVAAGRAWLEGVAAAVVARPVE